MMPKSERVKYLGKPKYSGDTVSFKLSSHLSSNLKDICDLVIEVFDATHCDVFVEYESQPVPLYQTDNALLAIHQQALSSLRESTTSHSEFAAQLTDSTNSLITAYSLRLPNNLNFGALVFSYDSSKVLTKKELRILSLVVRDIETFFIHQKEEFEVEKSNELLQLMLQTNKDWIFVKDKDFKIVYANDAFLNLYPPEMRDKVIGHTTIEEYDKQATDISLENDRIAFDKGISQVVEELHMPDGSHLIVDTTKQRFDNDAGEAFILGVCRDITDNQMLIRSLQKAYQELDEFTSIASHDLKSPLNAIRRLLKWIEEETEGLLPPNAKENLNFVVSRAERMHSLLNDLLTFAKIGRDEAKFVQLSLKSTVEEMRPLLDGQNGFELHCDELLMYAPEVPIKTILLNLISNALKHNDKEMPVINISTSISKHYYIIAINDNGPGIPEKFHDRIFKLFQMLRPRDEVEGSGMGLSVVKKYVDHYFGKLEVESDGEHGTTFTIYWPIKPNNKKHN